MAITASWGANFAVIKLALDAMGDEPGASSLFAAARFSLAAVLLSPALLSASSKDVVRAGVIVGLLCTAGYAAQVVALDMGSRAGTTAFICSLQAVVVALSVSRLKGGVEPRTWAAIALSILGVGCLELPGVMGEGGGLCLGDLVAFGQPLGFGASYVVLEKTMAENPKDELPISSLQVFVMAVAGVAAASTSAGSAPWELPWDHLLLPAGESAQVAPAHVGTLPAWAAPWALPGAVLYTGAVSTALTIWLQAIVFAKLPAVEASLVLTTEPLWATAIAVMLLGDRLGASDYVGGALIIGALATQLGVFDSAATALLRGESPEERQ